MTVRKPSPTRSEAPRALPPEIAGRYERYEGLHVLRVSGTDYEMGLQHGTILADAIARGPLPYFARYVAQALGGAGGLPPGASRTLGKVLGSTVGRRIAARFPEETAEGLRGLAEGSGMPLRDVRHGVTMPETYLWVLQRYKELHPAPLAPRLGVPLLGCTSAIAWGEATASGRLLHGRNFDYQGVGAWDREQAVVFARPADGHRYMSVTSAGVLLGGITAMNDQGLSLVVHQHMSASDFDLGGLPVGIAGDRVMRHAASLDDARRILDAHTPSGPWTYLVASAREKAVLCYEVTSRKRAHFFAEGDTFALTNLYMHPDMDGQEVFFYPAYWRNNAGRYHRARELLARDHGRLDERLVASILGDIGDPRCRFASSIAVLVTVGSVVFDAERGIAWVATGQAPVSSRRYVAFDLGMEAPRPDLAPLPGAAVPEPARHGFDLYRMAYEAAFNERDVPKTRALLDEVVATQPEQPVYRYCAGLLALGAGDLAQAIGHLDAAVALGHPEPARRAAFHLWRGRARDRAGDRTGAIRDYREAILGDPGVRKAAERGIRRPFKGRKVSYEWTFGDVLL